MEAVHMDNSDSVRLVLVHASGPEDPHGAAVADWVASTAWSVPGFRLDEVHPRAPLCTGPDWTATTPGPVDPARRVIEADAVVIVISQNARECLDVLEALVERVGEHWRGKQVALVCTFGASTRRMDDAVARLRKGLSRASLDRGIRISRLDRSLEGCGCTPPDVAEAHELRAMFIRLLTRVGRRGRTAARASVLAVA